MSPTSLQILNEINQRFVSLCLELVITLDTSESHGIEREVECSRRRVSFESYQGLSFLSLVGYGGVQVLCQIVQP